MHAVELLREERRKVDALLTIVAKRSPRIHVNNQRHLKQIFSQLDFL